jgi:amino acid transporter
MNPNSGKENLKREIAVLALSLAVLNITVGTGIFVISAIIAENLGAAAIVAASASKARKEIELLKVGMGAFPA